MLQGFHPYLGGPFLLDPAPLNAKRILIDRNDLRRTHSSILQDNREDVKVVQELLRHSLMKMTLDVYAQANTDSNQVGDAKSFQQITATPCLRPVQSAVHSAEHHQPSQRRSARSSGRS